MSQFEQMEFLYTQELIVDNFAGGGGASTGIEWAFGRNVDIAINHDPEAVAMHEANHPNTRHFCEDVFSVNPVEAVGGRPVGLAWFSPDCKHFSKAKGGKPVSKKIRGLAWIVVKWARLVRPRVIMLENVEEFEDWGPLVFAREADGTYKLDREGNPAMMPCPDRKGQTFQRWKSDLERLGYRIEWRQLRACDYGAPTIRKRLFVVARCDGRPIVWPTPTHGDPKSKEVRKGKLDAYRTAAECIDFSLPTPSIFLTEEEGRAIGVKRPLAENTMKRIARGVMRYVIEAKEPFIVKMNHTASYYDCFRGQSINEPLQTVTSHPGFGIVQPFFTEHANASNQRNMPANEPLRTITAETKGGTFALVAPHLTKFRTGSTGVAMDEPMPTITANSFIKRPGGAPPIGLVSAFLAKHYGGNYTGPGVDLHDPTDTVTTTDHHAYVACHIQRDFGASIGHPVDEPSATVTAGGGGHSSLVTSSMIKLRGTCKDGQPVDKPAPTVTAGGNHVGEVRAFLVKYYGTDQDPRLDEPMHTVTTKERFGLVTVAGQQYVIADIGMRMLAPRELYRAQGFPDTYKIDIEFNGKPLSKAAQIRMCGNSVSPHVARALIEANVGVRRSAAVA